MHSNFQVEPSTLNGIVRELQPEMTLFPTMIWENTQHQKVLHSSQKQNLRLDI